MKFKTTIAAVAAVAMLAVPAVTMAAPDTTEAAGWEFKTNTTYDQPNLVGKYDAQIIHNGWAVGGNKHSPAGDGGADQTTDSGTRAASVQGVLAQQGKGSLAK